MSIIGINENATGVKRMISAWIVNEANKSEDAVQHEGLYRDAYALDSTKDNLELYIHYLFPDRLAVRTTKPIPAQV